MATPNRSLSLVLPNELLDDICGYLSLGEIKKWAFACRQSYINLIPILIYTDAREECKAAYWACKNGRLDILRTSLASGTNVNHMYPPVILSKPCWKGKVKHLLGPPEKFPTLLHVATYYDHIDIIRFLISCGGNVKAQGQWRFRNYHNKAPLYFARSPDVVKLLVSGVRKKSFPKVLDTMIEGPVSLSAIETLLPRIDIHSLNPQTLLESACKYHRPDIFDLLIRQLRITPETNNKLDPIAMITMLLDIQVLPINEETYEQLLDRILLLPQAIPAINIVNGFHSHYRYSHYMTILMMSLEAFVPVSATRRLLHIGADLHEKCYWYWNPNHIPRHPYWRSTIFGFEGRCTALDFALALVEMNETSRNERRITRQKIQLLLEHGAGFEPRGYPVSFLLMSLTWPNSGRWVIGIIQRLCPDLFWRQRNRFGETHLSSLLGWFLGGYEGKQRFSAKRRLCKFSRLVCHLLRSDRSKTYITTAATSGPFKGLLPVEMACRFPLWIRPWKEWYNECKTEYYVLMIIESLFVHGSCANTKDADGRSLLHWAAEMGAHYRVRLLLENGATVGDVDKHGFTALHLACQLDTADQDPEQSLRRIDIVKQLLEGGADINAKTDEGFTPLFLACQTLDELLVEVLLSFGALILDDNYGRSPQDALRLAELQYHYFQLVPLGAMHSMLFHHGDAEYIYDLQAPILSLLADHQLTEDSRPRYYYPSSNFTSAKHWHIIRGYNCTDVEFCGHRMPYSASIASILTYDSGQDDE
ncbi:ankyrin [Xylariaceae sp. FL0662B]|nr:ankyrin [Xylariaceae sp. FL0662B]